jgi:hypothetical protein
MTSHLHQPGANLLPENRQPTTAILPLGGFAHMSEPIDKIIILGEVTIHAVASDEDPYGTGGFSSITANIVVSDRASAAALNKSYAEKKPISIRCGGLEFDGVVYRYTGGLLGAKAVMSVDNLQKGKAN